MGGIQPTSDTHISAYISLVYSFRVDTTMDHVECSGATNVTGRKDPGRPFCRDVGPTVGASSQSRHSIRSSVAVWSKKQLNDQPGMMVDDISTCAESQQAEAGPTWYNQGFLVARPSERVVFHRGKPPSCSTKLPSSASFMEPSKRLI